MQAEKVKDFHVFLPLHKQMAWEGGVGEGEHRLFWLMLRQQDRDALSEGMKTLISFPAGMGG